MSEPTAFVSSPNRKPRKGGIFAVADEVQVPRLGAAAHVEWVSDPCDFPHQWAADCWGDTDGDTEKDPDGLDTLTSSPVFTLYAGVECFVGPDDDFEARAQQALLQGRDRVIEAKLNAYLEQLAGGAAPVFETPLSLMHAIEGWADGDYIGQPVIVMDRGNAIIAAVGSAVDWDREGNIWTPNGTPILASASVSSTMTFITGQITVYSTPVTVSRGNDYTTNRTMAIAEQSFAIGIDCDFVRAAAINQPDKQTVTLTASNAPEPATVGDTVTVTVTVSPTEAARSGVVSVKADDWPNSKVVTIGADGTGTLDIDTTDLAPGDYPYTVTFTANEGSVYEDASATGVITVVSAQQPTMTVLVVDNPAPALNATITFTAAVDPTDVPGRVMLVKDGADFSVLGSFDPATGEASGAWIADTAGSFDYTARFEPTDTDAYLGSTSPVVTVVVS